MVELVEINQNINEVRWVYRLGGVPTEILKNDIELFRINESIADELGLDRQERIQHQWTPHGYTGGLILGKSHELWHTWPELEYMSIDLFTCSPNLDLSQAPTLLLARYNPAYFGVDRFEAPQMYEVFKAN